MSHATVRLDRGPLRLPTAHEPLMVNPSGFSCANCGAYGGLRGGVPVCKERSFAVFYGSDEIRDPKTGQPVDPKFACSDWFRPR